MVDELTKEGIDISIENITDVEPNHLADLKKSDKNSLVYYVGNEKSQVDHLEDCVLICLPGLDFNNETVTKIICSDPKLAFCIVSKLLINRTAPNGIHPTAIVSEDAEVHPTVSIGPYSVLEKCVIGEETVVHSNVVIYSNSRVGKRVVIEANSCIGATGVNWAWDYKGKQSMMPQIGGTVIGDDCFIGTNVSIVRGSLNDTVIEKECKIAHGTMIGHDCRIGEQTHIANGIAMGGSAKLGQKCFVGSGARFRPGVSLGNKIVVSVGAAVVKDCLEENTIMTGVPAVSRKRGNRNLKGVPEFNGP